MKTIAIRTHPQSKKLNLETEIQIGWWVNKSFWPIGSCKNDSTFEFWKIDARKKFGDFKVIDLRKERDILS